jgi:hypothetical protein
MKLWSKSATVLAFSVLLTLPPSAGANILHQDSSKRLVKVLSDHPGAATALTSQQKSEIRKFLAKSPANKNIVCTGTSLARQSESMYRIVRLRAKLVCQYAKSVDPSVKTNVKEKVITASNLNGRVQIVSF